jgi:hypothetical protein
MGHSPEQTQRDILAELKKLNNSIDGIARVVRKLQGAADKANPKADQVNRLLGSVKGLDRQTHRPVEHHEVIPIPDQREPPSDGTHMWGDIQANEQRREDA